MSRPWMPLYVADYLADTGHLSTTEHGAYLLLIMHYWQNGGLPDDEAKLARICRLTAKEWAGHRDTLADLFGEGWSHARIDRELCSARDAYERRAKAGQKGGKAAAKGKPEPSNATSIAQARLKQSQSQSQLEPSREGEVSTEELHPLPEEAREGGLNVDERGAVRASEPAAWPDPIPFGRTAAAGGAR